MWITDEFSLWSLVYSIKFQIRKIPAQKKNLGGNNQPFLSSLLLCGSKCPKKIYTFPIWNFLPQASQQKKTYFVIRKGTVGTQPFESFTFFQNGENNSMRKIWTFDATGAFPYTTTPDIDFTDEAVVQCDVSVIKVLSSLIVIYKWPQTNFDVNTSCTVSGPGFAYCFNFLRNFRI